MAFIRGSQLLLAFASLMTVGAAGAAVPSAPPQICMDTICPPAAGATTTTTSTGKIKWHPGHYMLSNEVDRSANGEVASKRAEQAIVVAAGANVLGWAGNYTWDVLEPSKGNYDFSHIDADIAALAGKRIIIGVQTDYMPSNHLPSYIVNDSAYGPSPNGGQYGFWTIYNGQGVVGAKWRAAVNNRWIALIQALAARYDSNPLVEAIIDRDETAWNLDGGSDFTVSGYRSQWQALASAGAAALTTTNFILQNNWAQSGSTQDTANLMQDAYTRRVGFGGPDIFGYSSEHAQPNYIWAQGVRMGTAGTSPGTDYRGKMPAIHDIQSPELIGPWGPFTPQDIFDFADRDLQISHMLWNYLGGTGLGNWSGGSNSVLAMINAHPVTNTACPTVYTAGCKTN